MDGRENGSMDILLAVAGLILSLFQWLYPNEKISPRTRKNAVMVCTVLFGTVLVWSICSKIFVRGKIGVYVGDSLEIKAFELKFDANHTITNIEDTIGNPIHAYKRNFDETGGDFSFDIRNDGNKTIDDADVEIFTLQNIAMRPLDGMCAQTNEYKLECAFHKLRPYASYRKDNTYKLNLIVSRNQPRFDIIVRVQNDDIKYEGWIHVENSGAKAEKSAIDKNSFLFAP
jgi:hypothetical protein